MTFIANIARIFAARFISVAYLISSILGAVGASSPAEPTEDAFIPVVRFAVCSDIHIKQYTDASAARLAELIRFMYDYSAAQPDYKGFDALCIAGDFTSKGIDTQYDAFLQVINENLRSETELLTCLGNHEYINTRDYDPTLSVDLYVEKMGSEPNSVHEINGYQFVCCSYGSNTANPYMTSSDWFERSVRTAVEESGDKPVFVMQHVAPFGTVYGSLSWGNAVITGVLAKYPTVIDFSGHSHYPINDPRSIWQGSFTALGCGTLYQTKASIDGIRDVSPYTYDQTGQFYIVEADAGGEVRIRAYDLITHRFFDLDYQLTGLAERSFAYTYERMYRQDDTPVFPEDAQIRTGLNENGETIISFDGATDDYVVGSYLLSVMRNGICQYSECFFGKYMYLYEPNHYDINVGTLEPGSYTVEIIAMNAYAKLSEPLSYRFTVA